MSQIEKVRKRDGSTEEFNPNRIRDAIHQAFIGTGTGDGKNAKEITGEVVEKLEERGGTPSVEEIQDLVVGTLREGGFEEVADDYQNYREQKEEIRKLKKKLGYRPEIKLSVNSLSVLRKRYLLRNDVGKIIETPEGMFERVAEGIAEVDSNYGRDPERSKKRFEELMSNLEFLPNSPTLFNTNAPLGGLSACYVLPVHDSLDSIFSTLKKMATVEQTGGGVGFNFSELRPEGDVVRSTHGIASGPVSFMRVYDTATEVMKQGGKRRGALMGILDVGHPEIMKFINAKRKKDILTNFNLSVSVTDEFMEKVENGGKQELINPRTDEVVKKVDAEEIWDQIVENAWATGDPGLLFIDEVNRHNPTPDKPIKATNPCGETPLLPHESCNLGSVNLSKMVEDGEIDWDRLKGVVKDAVHFLDNVIDANEYPYRDIEEKTRATRKIGLGVMGFADMLIQLGVPYDSEDALELAEKIMKFVQEKAREKSVELGRSRGSFPRFEESVYSDEYEAMRNATVTTIAPTGTISIIANCSSGIEPLFAVSFIRNVMGGSRLLEINPYFERISKEHGFYSSELLDKVSRSGSVQDLDGVPEDVKKLFKTALEIDLEWHVRMQAAFQKYVDNSVSKTINLPREASREDVSEAFKLAHRLDCKGITVYRYGSKEEQVLTVSDDERLEAGSEFTGNCKKCHL